MTKNHNWGTIQRLASDRQGGGGASLLPSTPAGVMGSDDGDDDDDPRWSQLDRSEVPWIQGYYVAVCLKSDQKKKKKTTANR